MMVLLKLLLWHMGGVRNGKMEKEVRREERDPSIHHERPECEMLLRTTERVKELKCRNIHLGQENKF